MKMSRLLMVLSVCESLSLQAVATDGAFQAFVSIGDAGTTRVERYSVDKSGNWKPANAATAVAYEDLRWKNFCHKSPDQMLTLVREYVFPFIKTLGSGKDTSFARYMSDAVFLIPTAKVLVTLVDEIGAMDLNNKDAMGDVYEELLNRVASSGTNGQFRTPRHITELIIALLRPTLEDLMCDPAMGSAASSACCAHSASSCRSSSPCTTS